LFARIRTAEQSLEAQLFEEGKSRTAGLHFLSVQAEAEERDSYCPTPILPHPLAAKE